MKLLLDEGLPKRLARALAPHEATLAQKAGWAGIRNGRLLALAAGSFDVLITVDQNLEHQQNLETLPIAVIVLRAPSNRFPDLAPLVPELLAALSSLAPRTLTHVGSALP